MAGPVTEGSIVGKLKLDDSDWNQKLDRAEERARELGRINPTITVSVDAEKALADLAAIREAAARDDSTVRIDTETSGGTPITPGDSSSTQTVHVESTGVDALAAAEARVTAAMDAAEGAARRAQTSSEELAAAQDAAAASSGALSASLTATDAALQRVRAAAEEAAAAQAALTAAQAQGAVTAVDEAAAEDVSAAARDRAASSGRGLQAQTALIIVGIAALVATAGPLAGWAAGVAGALGAMGVAGVAAIYGIKQEMESGTAVGNDYRAGLNNLKSGLDAVAATGATAFLSSFQRGVGILDSALPTLNSMVGNFAGILGGVATTALQGAVNLITVLNPLFVQAATYIQQVADGFLAWTNNGGLASFAAMAQQTFPMVVQMIGSVLDGAMNLIIGLQDLAPAILLTATAIGRIASFLGDLAPVLGPVALGIAAAAGATAAWNAILPFLNNSLEKAGAMAATFGIEMDVALGPLGLIAAAIGVAVAAFAIITSATQNAAQAQTTYTSAIQQDTGVLGENTRAQVAKALADEGAFQSASKLGISQGLLTDAVLGQGDALQKVNGLIQKNGTEYDTISGGAGQAGIQVKNLSASALDLQKKLNDQSSAVKASVQSYKDQKAAADTATAGQTSLAGAYGATVSAYQTAKQAADNQTQSSAAATLQMQLEDDAAGVLKDTLDKLNGKTLSAADAQNAFDSQLSNMGTHVDTAGKTITFTTSSITDMSSASVALRGQLNGQVEALQNNVQAQVDLTGSTAKSIPMMQDMRQKIIDNAVAHGVNRDAVTKYIDSILQIPKTVPPTKLDVDDKVAAQKVADFKKQLQVLADSPYTATVNVNTGGAQAQVAALNNAIDRIHSPTLLSAPQVGPSSAAALGAAKAAKHADGGTISGKGNAWNDMAGLYRLADGEEVISNKFGQADRNRGLLKAINAGYVPTAGPSQDGSTPTAVAVSLAGATLSATIDGQPLTILIQDQIAASSTQRALSLSTGSQRVKF